GREDLWWPQYIVKDCKNYFWASLVVPTCRKKNAGTFIAAANATASGLATGRSGCAGTTRPAGLSGAAPTGASIYGRTKARSHPASERLGQRSVYASD